jgi:hypothetical protein
VSAWWVKGSLSQEYSATILLAMWVDSLWLCGLGMSVLGG